VPLHPAAGRPSHLGLPTSEARGQASQSRSQGTTIPTGHWTFVQFDHEKPVGAGRRQDRLKIAE
jgi:hypothetical protein